MKKLILPTITCALVALSVGRAQAVELLVSGDFETPGGSVGEVPGWTLLESVTGSSDTVDSASITGAADAELLLKGFSGGGPLTPAQGNFDNDSLPAGDVDGRDFLIWQRNVGVANATPEQGDATGDMMVDGADLALWQSNYGRNPAGRFTNASLIQKVPAVPGNTYTFQGTSTFEPNYSGFVTTLGDASPHGQIPSPTTTQFRMEFLDSGGAVIGEPTTLDLRPEQTFPDFPIVHTPLVAMAPVGAVEVRVVAEALNMAWNGSTESEGAKQSAKFNDFSLTRSGASGNLLTNGNLDAGIPDALDFWNQVETPTDFTPFDQILRTPVEGFSNHTPNGTRGVWLSAFFGFADPPNDGVWSVDEAVDGIISQTVGAVAGGTYTFSGWTKFEALYSGGVDIIQPGESGLLPPNTPSPTVTEIRLEFLDNEENVIGSEAIDVKAARRLISPTGNANDNIWYEHILEAVAPAGTVKARLIAQMIDGVYNTGGGGQSAFFDDFSLDGPAPPSLFASNSAVPEPTTATSILLGLAALGLLRSRRSAA